MAARTRSTQKILDSTISLMMLLRLLLDALLQLFQSCRVGERRESKIVQRLKSRFNLTVVVKSFCVVFLTWMCRRRRRWPKERLRIPV